MLTLLIINHKFYMAFILVAKKWKQLPHKACEEKTVVLAEAG